MGFTTHLWKCNKCDEQILYISKQKHPSINHECKNKMDAKYKAKELLEKFSTRKDALLAVDMLIVYIIAVKGKEDVLTFHLEDVKYHIVNN
jgi:mRNA-degrading endonuclease YafQ of YafQ-DinJ toxin-antitoxin module